jgi:hypothetical protein
VASADGTRFETAVERELQAQGLRVVKPRQTRAVDVGDLWVGDDVVVQAKAWQNTATALREGTRGAEVQAVHARRRFGVAVIKQPRRPVSEAYVAMPLRVFADLLKSRESPEQ